MIAGRRVVGVAAGLALGVAASPAVAEPWRGRAEGGVEYDSNVRRVEDRLDPAGAPMMRARATVDARGGKARRVRWSLALGGGARSAVAGAIDTENVLTASVDAAASHRTSDTLVVGARATHYEVFPLAAPEAARAFAASGADLAATVADDAGRSAMVAAGLRRLAYKPDPDFDWTGPALQVTLTQGLWHGADERAIDLAVGYRLEHRRYRGLAYASACAPGAMLDAHCFVPGDRARVDLVHVASARVAYTGARVWSLGYELTVDDSTSFGASLVRHRLTAAVTTPLPARVFATVSATGQLDRYPEPQLVARDIANQTFASLDDEARSSAAVRLGRGLGAHWQAELRWSLHVSALGDAAASFRRQLIYGGLTWER